MKCFYHADVDAVGLCKHCSRGVCKACAAEREGGLACAGKHEDMVDSVSTLVARNVRITSRIGPLSILAVAIYWGAVAVLIYLLSRETSETMRIMFGLMAAAFLVPAIANTRILMTRSGK